MFDSRDDIIVAIASPPGRSSFGLLRFSGPGSAAWLRRWRPLADASQEVDGEVDGEIGGGGRGGKSGGERGGEMFAVRIQPTGWSDSLAVMACRFVQPHSYTGQESLEIRTVGNPVLLDRLLLAAVRDGARLAEPGEFTFRAYLNGKLDLTQAEGVAATISARNDAELQAAALLRQGCLGQWAHALVDELADLLALVESGIDFTDQEDVQTIAPATLYRRLQAIQQNLTDRLDRSRSWESLQALARVVLAGRPSSGKSSLFNALLGHQRAVTDQAHGTTRDVLSEPLTISLAGQAPLEILLQDVAGLGHVDEHLQSQPDQAARDALAQADLILFLDDGGDDAQLQRELPPGVAFLHLRSKADLLDRPADSALAVSSISGQGLDELRQQIIHRLHQRSASLSGDLLAIQPRHEQAMRSAQDELGRALLLVEPRVDHASFAASELVADHLRGALNWLGALGGQLTPDDVIGRVFSRFCVGK